MFKKSRISKSEVTADSLKDGTKTEVTLLLILPRGRGK
jgi:hypothetical protein